MGAGEGPERGGVTERRVGAAGRGKGAAEEGWEERAVAAGAGLGCDERGGRCSANLELALLKMLIVCNHKFRVFVSYSLAFLKYYSKK